MHYLKTESEDRDDCDEEFEGTLGAPNNHPHIFEDPNQNEGYTVYKDNNNNFSSDFYSF